MTRAIDSKLILASGSPRRKQLLLEAGYAFDTVPPRGTAECGICTQETPPEMVARLALQKARDVAERIQSGVIVGADTVVECCGQLLGKPKDRGHASTMLQLIRGRTHHVYTGVCLWRRPNDKTLVKVDVTELVMEPISDVQLESYLDSSDWQGKAGAFGYQDGHDWLKITQGSPSNVVGLPMELLKEMLDDFLKDV